MRLLAATRKHPHLWCQLLVAQQLAGRRVLHGSDAPQDGSGLNNTTSSKATRAVHLIDSSVAGVKPTSPPARLHPAAFGQSTSFSPSLACSFARQTRKEVVSPAASAAARSVERTSSANRAHSACAVCRLRRNAAASLRHGCSRQWVVAFCSSQRRGVQFTCGRAGSAEGCCNLQFPSIPIKEGGGFLPLLHPRAPHRCHGMSEWTTARSGLRARCENSASSGGRICAIQGMQVA